jgi:FtsP/CotA-like multicopper oxidase with cupredoxin domain
VRPITRRQALQLGGLGGASIAIGTAGLVWERGSRLDPVTGSDLTEPEVLRSRDGLLRVRLEAAESRIRVAGRDATVYGYNGNLPGPTLRLSPGNRLQVRLVNSLETVTNLHVHGLHVSPQGDSDNVFVSVEPGESFDYDYQLPEDHPPGVYWYHPHHHGMVADQVFRGLYGAIIVEDPDPIPVTRERVLVISDLTLDGDGQVVQPSTMGRMMGREGDLVLVNGQAAPRLSARPGERERWRIVNACSARYLRLRLDGQDCELLGIDSGRFPAPQSVDEIVLATGNRADLLVTTRAGSASWETGSVDRGGMGMMSSLGDLSGGVGALATLRVEGDTALALPAVPAQPTPEDLRAVEPAKRRRITFAMGMGGGMGGGGEGEGMGMSFTVDGREFDEVRIDQTVQQGSVEEWTLVNDSPMDHPIHLHVWPMQITETAGQEVDGVIRQDVVNVPARSEVTARVSFDNYTGRTVYHCHILDHEDNGMMAVLESVPAA